MVRSHVLGYNLRRPYKMVIAKTGTLIVQDGIVYEMGSGRPLGPVANHLEATNKDILYCKFSGATFPNTPQGKIALQAYQDRKGYINKEADGKQVERESTLEERKAEIKERREKLNKIKE